MIAFSPSRFPFPLPEKHRFPVEKYALLRQRLEKADWQIHDATKASWDSIHRVHSQQYTQAWIDGTLDKNRIRALGFPWSTELMDRSLASVGGTIQAAAKAIEIGFCANLAGGTHHAFADRGEGFCVFNDVIVAATLLHDQSAISTAAVVDLDVHQGNGTAAMATDLSWLTTISVHGAKNYPFKKECSDLDVPLPDQINGEDYLHQIDSVVLPKLAEAAADIVFLNAGADVLSGDRYGRLNLSASDIAIRDRRIASFCRQHETPLVWVMGGGYHREIEKTVDAHFQSLQAVAAEFDFAQHNRHNP